MGVMRWLYRKKNEGWGRDRNMLRRCGPRWQRGLILLLIQLRGKVGLVKT